MPSTRHRVELSIAAALSGVGSRSALPQGAWRANAAPGPAAEAAKVPAAAHSSAAAVRSGLRGLVVLRAPPDRVQEYLQGRRIGAQTGVKIHCSGESRGDRALRSALGPPAGARAG